METKTHTSTTEEFAIFERVVRIVSGVRGTKPDYTRLAAELASVIPFDVFGVVLLRHDRQAVRVSICRRDGASWLALYHQHPLEGSMLEHVLRAPALVVKNYPDGLDGPPVSSGDALSSYHQVRATLIAPLVVDERILGTLEFGSLTPDAYADTALQRLIDAVARVLATAIERTQLGGSAEIQEKQRQALKDVSSALTSKTDVATILEQIVIGISNALDVSSAIVSFDRREGKLHLEAQAGLDRQLLYDTLNTSVTGDENIVGYTIRRRLPAVSHDIAVDERFTGNRALCSQLGVHSIYSYPLVTGTSVYGALLLLSPEPGGFTPLKVDILSLFASQATIAIHNGMLLESTRQRRRFQAAIEHLEYASDHPSYDEAATSGDGRRSVSSHSVDTEQGVVHAGAHRSEDELLAHVREETQRTFGVSFTSLLRFISEHLLTQNERDLQSHLSAYQDDLFQEPAPDFADAPLQAHPSIRGHEFQAGQQWDPLADNLLVLTQTAEAALVRAGVLGELSRLMMQLKQSTDSVKDAWFVVDLSGVCMYMNPAAETLCRMRIEDVEIGYDAQFLVPTPGRRNVLTIEDIFADLLPRIRNQEEVRTYLMDFTQGNLYRQELRCVLALEQVSSPFSSVIVQEKRGSLLPESAPSDYHYQLVRYPLYNQQGQLLANALQVHDVTEQVRDEKNRSTLLSSVSHDLRTPLTTIKAAVTGLLQTDVAWSEQDRQGMLEDIDVETDHLTVLVNGLVEMSRIEMGALILEKEWCDIVEVVHGTLAKVERSLGDHPVRTHIQPHLPFVFVDHVQMERVFYNLIENAAHHSPDQAAIEMILDVVNETLDARPSLPYLRVQVIDHGQGVPEHERERIFMSFYGMRSYGNGLGLAICKGIVEAHQGRIWVEGVADNGSCFVFLLPVHPYSVAHSSTGAVPSTDAASLQSFYELRREE